MRYPGRPANILLRTLLALCTLSAASFAAEPSAAQLAAGIRDAGLDPSACYRVLDLDISREDLHVYLTSGYLIFGKPVNGVRLTAVFSADVEDGDAEVLLLPPRRSERLSLATFAHVPNLEEHFSSAIMVFTDSTAGELLAAIRKQQSERGNIESPEMGGLLAANWNSIVGNIADSFDVRLVRDLLSPNESAAGVFFMAVAGRKLGNFDVVYDPRAPEQITVGQFTHRNDRSVFDVWTSFESRSVRNGSRKPPGPAFSLSDFHIDARLARDLSMKAVTSASIRLSASARAFQFEISPRVRVTGATLDGEPAEVFERESLRDTAIRGSGTEPFLVVASHPLAPGAHRVEFRHEGSVVVNSGNGVYYVGARGAWYPHQDAGFANYDLTFHYPADLTLVSTGHIVGERVEQTPEGEMRVTRRITNAPVRMAGFNLGYYRKIVARQDAYTIEVYGNRRLEPALQPKPVLEAEPPTPPRRFSRRPPDLDALRPVSPPPLPDPAARLRAVASDVASAFDFMTARFGPAGLDSLTVSPIPGSFGQGFPGLVYLSTISYLNPRERPLSARGQTTQIFFSDLLVPHEVAHQWWGNLVIADSYQDSWMMEALANYSALLYLEKRKGVRALDAVLDRYRADLLAKGQDGRSIESDGPITWGFRLRGSPNEDAWRAIVYEKGSWIIHMLRRRMGDAAFNRMLAEICRRYRYASFSTGDLRRIAEEFLPPRSPEARLDNFFDTWVYDTGIPTLKLSYGLHGRAPSLRLSGTVTQTGVPDEFSIVVPVEIFTGGAAPIVRWVHTSSDPAPFSVLLRQPPSKVMLPADSILAVCK